MVELHEPVSERIGKILRENREAQGLTRQQLDRLSVPLYAAALWPDSRPVTGLDLKRSCVVIGNEAHGVSDETAACCAGSVIIPIQSAESLNAGVAAGILMWEMRRC